MSDFDAASTTDDVLGDRDLRGKRVLVTGVSSGLGVETARSLAARGAYVVGAARDLTKGEAATAGLRQSIANSGGFELIELDLASLSSVRACADSLLTAAKPFDVVIANAGVMACPFGHTADGFEIQFGTNHLGHFVLANRIRPLMPANSRLVVLSSSAHRSSDVDLDDPNFASGRYNARVSYARSKTANVLFAVEFDRRHRGAGVRAAAVHPGVIDTGLGRHLGEEVMTGFHDYLTATRAAKGLPAFKPKSVPQGAATSVWAGFVADAEAVGGQYCEDCRVAEPIIGEPEPDGGGVQGYAVDQANAAALWAKSEELVGERF